MNAEKLVTEWEKHWRLEGRLEGGLDKFVRADLIARISAASTAAVEPSQPKTKKGSR